MEFIENYFDETPGRNPEGDYGEVFFDLPLSFHYGHDDRIKEIEKTYNLRDGFISIRRLVSLPPSRISLESERNLLIRIAFDKKVIEWMRRWKENPKIKEILLKAAKRGEMEAIKILEVAFCPECGKKLSRGEMISIIKDGYLYPCEECIRENEAGGSEWCPICQVFRGYDEEGYPECQCL